MIEDDDYEEATCSVCDRPLGYQMGGYWHSESDVCGYCEGGRDKEEDNDDEPSTWEPWEM
jgi:hypothetical protein